MDYFKYKFLGDDWNIYLIDENDNDISDEDAAAETKFDNKEIYFRRNHYDYLHIKHEIGHVYISYLYLEHTNDISAADFEEIITTMLSHRLEQIQEDAKYLQMKLDELKSKDK